MGDSIAPKNLIEKVFENNSKNIKLLDIGFGVGKLGELIKNNKNIQHWQIDGIDGIEPNCHNQELINKKSLQAVQKKNLMYKNFDS